MLYYNRIDLSEGTDAAKSKECLICNYWYFDPGFKFQKSVCNGCHDLLMLYLNISEITSITLSLLKVLIIVVLFITLANLMQTIY